MDIQIELIQSTGLKDKFPAPLEVDRKLYNFPWSNGCESGLLFSAPFEVNRFLYGAG